MNQVDAGEQVLSVLVLIRVVAAESKGRAETTSGRGSALALIRDKERAG